MISNNKIGHAERFYQTMIELSNLLYEIISVCYENKYTTLNPLTIKAAELIIKLCEYDTIIVNFIDYSLSIIENNKVVIWEKILTRDESFFLENANDIFAKDSYVPVDNINAFKIIFTTLDPQGNPIISDEEKIIIWEYFDTLLKISIKFIHDGRKPYLNDNQESCYKERYYSDIPILEYAKRYNLQLSFA